MIKSVSIFAFFIMSCSHGPARTPSSKVNIDISAFSEQQKLIGKWQVLKMDGKDIPSQYYIFDASNKFEHYLEKDGKKELIVTGFFHFEEEFLVFTIYERLPDKIRYENIKGMLTLEILERNKPKNTKIKLKKMVE